MNASKTLTAIAAAAALVGSIGYASAQSQGGDSMQPNDPNAVQQQPVTPAPATTDTTTSTMPSDTTSSTVDTERAPQADRN